MVDKRCGLQVTRRKLIVTWVFHTSDESQIYSVLINTGVAILHKKVLVCSFFFQEKKSPFFCTEKLLFLIIKKKYIKYKESCCKCSSSVYSQENYMSRVCFSDTIATAARWTGAAVRRAADRTAFCYCWTYQETSSAKNYGYHWRRWSIRWNNLNCLCFSTMLIQIRLILRFAIWNFPGCYFLWMFFILTNWRRVNSSSMFLTSHTFSRSLY